MHLPRFFKMPTTGLAVARRGLLNMHHHDYVMPLAYAIASADVKVKPFSHAPAFGLAANPISQSHRFALSVCPARLLRRPTARRSRYFVTACSRSLGNERTDHPPDKNSVSNATDPLETDELQQDGADGSVETFSVGWSKANPAFRSKEDDPVLVSATAAFQVDDGSLSENASFVAPRRLRRKGDGTGAVASSPTFSMAGRISSLFNRFVAANQIPKSMLDVVFLALLFITWYWSNTAFNVFNKQVLKVFPFPVTCTVVQFFVAAVCMVLLWILRLKERPHINRFLLRATLPLGVLHAAGFLLTNMSLGKVSVAFTHTVKSTEPFFSVALTPSILGEVPTWGIMISLFPIVAGVALASATEVSFNWIGFLAAVGSNVALQSRNVLSKKLMTRATGDGKIKSKKFNKSPVRDNRVSTGSLSSNPNTSTDDKRHGFLNDNPSSPNFASQSAIPLSSDSNDDIALPFTEQEDMALRSLDNVNLFATMTILAFILLLPLSFLSEGMPLLGAYAAPAVTGMSSIVMYRKLAIGGICRCLDVLSSYMILQRVSPVTHSVGNCVKRAVVIAFSIVIFKTQMSLLNIVGTMLALTGVFIYSLVISACKQNSFGPDSPMCKPIYEMEVELTEGGGI